MAVKVIDSSVRSVRGQNDPFQAEIAKRKWGEAQNMMDNPHQYDSSKELAGAVTENNHILHFVCQFNPPLSIVRCIARINPSSSKTVDENGRYALHIASKYGASPEIVQFLILDNRDAAEAKDQFGKFPIHYFGECYAKSFETLNTMVDDIAALRLMSKNMLQIAKLLNRAAPLAATSKDSNGKTAIDYAIAKRTDNSVIMAMEEKFEEKRSQNGGVKFADDVTVSYYRKSSFEFEEIREQLQLSRPTV